MRAYDDIPPVGWAPFIPWFIFCVVAFIFYLIYCSIRDSIEEKNYKPYVEPESNPQSIEEERAENAAWLKKNANWLKNTDGGTIHEEWE